MMQFRRNTPCFPALIASLNGTSAVLLLIGRGLIKRGQMAAHRAYMIAAVVSSSIVSRCYLYFHCHVGSVHFLGTRLVAARLLHHSDFPHVSWRW